MIKNLILMVFCLGVIQTASIRASAQAQEENEEAGQEFKNTRWFKLMQRPNADYFSIKKKFDRYMRRHPTGDGPVETGEEWFRRNIYYLDSKGRVQEPPAFDYLHLRRGVFPAGSATDTMAGDWHMTGPRNLVLPGDNTRGGFSYCVRMDPTNVQKLFISFETGGLWVSSDGGTDWHLTDGNMPDNHYFDIEVCAANSNVVYAISQSAVIKSVDGGYTWAVTGMNSSSAGFTSGQGYDLAVSPSSPDVVVARWGNSLYRTTDGGATWASVLGSLNGIYTDGYLNNTGGLLEWSNNDPNRVFLIDAALGGPAATVYSSSDQGGTFSSLAAITLPADIPKRDLRVFRVVTATDQPSVVFALLNSGWGYLQLYGVDVGTGTVTLVRKNMVNNSGCDAFAMDSKNSNNIVYGSYGETVVHYSTNNGQSFAASSNMHYDIRSIHIVGGKVMVGNDGETVISTNNGATFSNVTAGISNIELWGFGSSFKSDILAAGCNHGPLMIRDFAAPGGWYRVLGADQQNTDVNPLDSVHIISRGYDAYFVTRTGVGTYTSGSAQVDPGREDWFNNLSYHPNLYNTIQSHTAGNFPQPYQANPTGERLTWRNSLLRSDDNGLTISYLVHTFSDRLMSEKICMRDTNRIYCIVSPSNNHLWKTADGGVTWAEITPGNLVTGTGVRNISDVAVSDVNPDEIWVTYSGVQNTCKVLHSTDGGGTYSNLTTAVLGLDPLRKIVFQRGTNGGVYVGNRSGVFYRNNSMSDWQPVGSGLPMLEVRNMFINYFKGRLLIGTSRGAWDHELYEHSATLAQISASTRTPDCQYPTVRFRDFSVVSNGGSGATYSWQFPGGSPSTSTSETPLVSYLGAAAGSYDVTLTVSDQYGTNTQTLSNFIGYSPVHCCTDVASGWSAEDIGHPSIAGTTCYQPDLRRFTVQASGADVWDNSDQFRYNDTVLNGNGEIVARVTGLSGPGSWAKAGVMIRETTDAGSKHAFVMVTPGNGVNMHYRTSTGGGTANTQAAGAASAAAPYWVKLARGGNKYTGYCSPDGVTWTSVDSVSMTMSGPVRIGLAVTSHDNSQLTTAVFDNVRLSSPCPAFTVQPVSGITCIGSTATFSAAVTGNGNDYQWQTNMGGGWFADADGSWSDGTVTGATTATLAKAVNASTQNGRQWRLQVTKGACPTIVSNPATLTVGGAAITAQPLSATAGIGSNATFSATVTGTGNSYQWESNKGAGWFTEADGNWSDGAVAGSTTPTLVKTVNASTQNGRQWRLRVTNGNCSNFVSDVVTLTITGGAASNGNVRGGSATGLSALSVYPNPANSTLTIAGMKKGMKVAIYNGAGQQVYRATGTGTKEIINIGKWTSGVYVVKVTGTDGGIEAFEVIKN